MSLSGDIHRVYIVDDNALVRQSLTALLDREPDLHTCGAAATAHQALAEIAEARPDVVLVDLRLNDGVGGVHLLQRLRRDHPDLPTLALTGHAGVGYRKRALEAGASRFLDKQDASRDLLPTLRELLSIHVGGW